MTGYHGFIQSVIRRGIDAYQVTLGIYPDATQGQETATMQKGGDNLLVYRADIAIEDDRTILFPDRELGKCMDAFYNPLSAGVMPEALETQRTVGGIAARICSQLSRLLLERSAAAPTLRSDPGKFAAHN